jgi:hypothetical protein
MWLPTLSTDFFFLNSAVTVNVSRRRSTTRRRCRPTSVPPSASSTTRRAPRLRVAFSFAMLVSSFFSWAHLCDAQFAQIVLYSHVDRRDRMASVMGVFFQDGPTHGETKQKKKKKKKKFFFFFFFFQLPEKSAYVLKREQLDARNHLSRPCAARPHRRHPATESRRRPAELTSLTTGVLRSAAWSCVRQLAAARRRAARRHGRCRRVCAC